MSRHITGWPRIVGTDLNVESIFCDFQLKGLIHVNSGITAEGKLSIPSELTEIRISIKDPDQD